MRSNTEAPAQVCPHGFSLDSQVLFKKSIHGPNIFLIIFLMLHTVLIYSLLQDFN